MAGYWINVFRRPDGRLVSREDMRGGRASRRSAETPMMYQGHCRFLYRVRIAPRCSEAERCGRVSERGFVTLTGPCPRCGADPLVTCASAFRVGAGG
ncbi:hypothetical protein [Methylobacterium nigriterrae]|uniref:hypothetical protein n=1 Tax=Methylobacterium nigriterrae TaxID=3127512 RepID=UPI0030137694